ncbi:unnamed protein product [Blepharisma stoltei]|uniref:Uncharacterized protein n=1 Tax=Blepharisma stoltei TaxID=1481888 RepID=A0AAU9J782_9CILI|nr:unnamed protein product [Blepharisma stoltei]
MDTLDADKEFSKIGSWISIRSLKDATNIQAVYRQHSRSSSADSTSPTPSADTSITMEWKPNTVINQSACFTFIHGNYNPDFASPYKPTITEISESPSGKQDLESIKYFLQNREAKLRKLQKRYKIDTAKLKEELNAANENIAKITKEANFYKEQNLKMKEEHALQIQLLQARHEQRMQRSKQELNILLGEFNEKTAELVTEKLNMAHQQEIDKIHGFYHEQIEQIREEYENELLIKDEENDELRDQLDRNSMLHEYATNNDTNKINNEKNHIIIRALEDQVEEQRSIIESQQRVIEHLTKELKSRYNRTPSRGKSFDIHGRKNSEKSLQTILDQLSSFIDTADPNSPRDFENTLRSLQSKIDEKNGSCKLSF